MFFEVCYCVVLKLAGLTTVEIICETAYQIH